MFNVIINTPIFFYSILLLLAFFQNAVFTAVSRSRNSGDIKHHAKWAILSNSIWFIMQIFVVKALWGAINNQEWGMMIITGIVYTIGTAAGSVWMMNKMLKSETGKQRVGSR